MFRPDFERASFINCLALTAILVLIISLIQPVVVANDKINFADENLEQAIKEATHAGKEITLSDLTHLWQLDASNNGIKELDGIENCKNLTFLRLDGNNIEDISPLDKLRRLGYLNLSANNISDISTLSDLKYIWALYLDHNKISDIQPLANLNRLSRLSLKGNKLQDISAIRDNQDLVRVNLSSNYLEVSPDSKDKKDIERLISGGADLIYSSQKDPAKLSKSKTESLTVDESEDTPSLAKAVRLAAPGDKIILEPGEYKANISINKDLTIEGSSPEKVTVSAIKAGPIIEIGPSNVSVNIKGIGISGGREDDSYESGSIFIKGNPNVTLKDIKVYRNSFRAFLFDGSATVRIITSHITRNNGAVFTSVFLGHDESSIKVIDSTIANNSRGIELHDSTTANFSGTKISGNGTNVTLYGSPVTTFSNCEISDTNSVMYLSNSAQVSVENSNISGDYLVVEKLGSVQIKDSNVTVGRINGRDNTTIEIKNSTLTSDINDSGNNKLIISSSTIKNAKIHLTGSATASLTDTGMFGGEGDAIEVAAGSSITLKNLEIRAYSTGINLDEWEKASSIPSATVLDSKLAKNRRGIVIYDSGKLTMKRSEVSENSEAGIDCSGDNKGVAEVGLYDSAVIANGDEDGVGIIIDSSDQIKVSNSNISKNGENGLKAEASAKLEVSSSKISLNGSSGILLESELINAVITDNEFNRNGQYGVQLTVKPQEFKGKVQGSGNTFKDNGKSAFYPKELEFLIKDEM